MATIKEMANNYAELLPQKRIAKKFCKIDYEAGAKAVLEIFEELVENRNFCAFPISVHQEFLDKIKELKGE